MFCTQRNVIKCPRLIATLASNHVHIWTKNDPTESLKEGRKDNVKGIKNDKNTKNIYYVGKIVSDVIKIFCVYNYNIS